MDLKISENFISLALNPKTGRFITFGNYLQYGILGAIIMDLYASGKVRFENKKIIVTERVGLTGMAPHDNMMEKFQKAKRPQRIGSWLKRFAFRATWYKRELMLIFVNNGRIKRERKHFLIIPYNLHFVSDTGMYDKLVHKLKEILVYGREPEDHDLMTLGLIYATKIHRVLATGDTSSRTIRIALRKIVKDNPVVSEIGKAVKEIQAAISASAAASSVTTH